MLIVGHRGAKGEAPENTLAGFAYARQQGLQAVEFDVRLTTDNHVVVMHDPTVDRTTNGNGAVSDLTLAELIALDARADFPHWPVACPVPSLAAVLDLVHDLEVIEIEFKRDAPDRLDRLAQLVVREIARRMLLGRVVLSSFDPVALEILQHYAPDPRRAYIGAWDTPDFYETARTLGCTQADISFRTGTVDAVNQAHDEGLVVVGWPCDPPTVEMAIGWHVDAVTTNSPAALRETFGQRSVRLPDQGHDTGPRR